MASVSSLDNDLRQMRLDKYTPRATNEVRAWIEEVLGDKLAPGDLLDALKDGVALCRLVYERIGLMSITDTICIDSSTMPCRLASSSSSRPCLSCKWKTYPTSSPPVRCLRSAFLHTISSSRLIFTRQRILRRSYNALEHSVAGRTQSTPPLFPAR
jgi:hypothetical protein